MPESAPATVDPQVRDLAVRLACRYLADELDDLRLPADRDILAGLAAGLGVTADPGLLNAATVHVDATVAAWRAQLADPTPQGGRHG
jgi:hypothetical protein